jgi:nicotinamide riboside transporter PnuC
MNGSAMLDVLQILSVVFGLAGNVLINRRNTNGFRFWIISNFIAIFIMAMANLWWMMIMFIAYLVLAVDGLKKWKSGLEPSERSLK